MSPVAVVFTAGLLGLFVLAGGCYGLCYGAGRLRNNQHLALAGFGCYGLQVLVTAALLAVSPLALQWKIFLALSTLAYAVIPPVTWRLLQRLHTDGEEVR